MTVISSALGDALRGRYLLERELGRGGMATVYLVRDLRHDRPVALKVLHQELAHALGPERFVQEIKVAARLQHPHILRGSCGSLASRCRSDSPAMYGCRFSIAGPHSSPTAR